MGTLFRDFLSIVSWVNASHSFPCDELESKLTRIASFPTNTRTWPRRKAWEWFPFSRKTGKGPWASQ